MTTKAFLALCASALFVQTITAQGVCGPAPAARSAPTPSCGAANYGNAGYGNAGYGNIVSANSASTSGGGFNVITTSPFAPNGISVVSENSISGTLAASGDLPVLAAVVVEGSLPTSGSAATTYSCGNGQVGISSDTLAASGLSASAGNAAAGAYGSGNYGAPCGCY